MLARLVPDREGTPPCRSGSGIGLDLLRTGLTQSRFVGHIALAENNDGDLTNRIPVHHHDHIVGLDPIAFQTVCEDLRSLIRVETLTAKDGSGKGCDGSKILQSRHHRKPTRRIRGPRGGDPTQASAGRYEHLLPWLAWLGRVIRVGVEGTELYGVDQACFLVDAHVEVVEVDRRTSGVPDEEQI